MGKVMTYKDYISTPSKIVNKLIDELDPVLDEMIEKFKEAYLKDFNKQPTDYDILVRKLNLLYDMVKSIEVYTKIDDELIEFKTYNSPKGNLVIDSIIERDDKRYKLSTDVIYAGGYNIQSLHFRYITKTDLPRTGNKELSDNIKERIKKLEKNEKIQKEIDYYEKLKKRLEDKPISTNLTDEEILVDFHRWRKKADPNYEEYIWPTWEEMIRRGATDGYNNSEEEFKKAEDEFLQGQIDWWKRTFLTTPKEKEKGIKEYQKKIDKLKSKL